MREGWLKVHRGSSKKKDPWAGEVFLVIPCPPGQNPRAEHTTLLWSGIRSHNVGENFSDFLYYSHTTALESLRPEEWQK